MDGENNNNSGVEVLLGVGKLNMAARSKDSSHSKLVYTDTNISIAGTGAILERGGCPDGFTFVCVLLLIPPLPSPPTSLARGRVFLSVCLCVCDWVNVCMNVNLVLSENIDYGSLQALTELNCQLSLE